MDPTQQRASFQAHGYLVLPGLLICGELAACRSEVERLHRVVAGMQGRREHALSAGGVPAA
ncbi:MAG: hypothetical protein AB1505_24060 [Candidatus Latescibacterota bacterium]